MLTDLQIKELGHRLSIPLDDVCFKDELPKLKFNKSYIINLQDSETDDGKQNEGTHWVFLQVNETPKGNIEPFYFDPYGAPPPESIKKAVSKDSKKYLPYSNKDIQSLMNNACGYYCLAMAHYINSFKGRTGVFYRDIDDFLDLFDDLNHSIDWKKNEYILKHFFQAEDPKKRIPIKRDETHDDYERIINSDTGGGIDMMKIPIECDVKQK